MKKFIIALLTVVASSYAVASPSAASNCGCTMPLTVELIQSERGFMRLVELTWSEAEKMISKSYYLDLEDRKDAAEKAGADGKISFYLLETTEYSGVKQEVLIVSPDKNCLIEGRYTTYLE